MSRVGFSGSVSVVFFFKQKTAYEMRISDWSSDVCSSDLPRIDRRTTAERPNRREMRMSAQATIDGELEGILDLPKLNQWISEQDQIGRASCRERVCQYV